MSGNTFGKLLKLTTFGESHGEALGGILDGCPAGIQLDFDFIQAEMQRRKPGQSVIVTQRKEEDEVQFLSGIFEGKTTGTPIGFIIPNTNQKSDDYSHIKDNYRPSHADYVYDQKYGFRDYRGGGRSSARMTAPMVAAGAIAKKWLTSKLGIEIRGCMTQIGEVDIPFSTWDDVHTNPFFAPNNGKVAELEAYMDALRKSGDSCGAGLRVQATGVPVGLGSPLYDKLDADIAHAMMSINAVKGVEIGAGFACIAQKGSEHGDEMTPEGFGSNHAGGILGGISTGQNIEVRMAIKPTSSIRLPRKSIDKAGNPIDVETYGRHDPCVGIRATPIAEAMLALVIMDHLLVHRAQCADVQVDTPQIPPGISNY